MSLWKMNSREKPFHASFRIKLFEHVFSCDNTALLSLCAVCLSLINLIVPHSKLVEDFLKVP